MLPINNSIHNTNLISVQQTQMQLTPITQLQLKNDQQNQFEHKIKILQKLFKLKYKVLTQKYIEVYKSLYFGINEFVIMCYITQRIYHIYTHRAKLNPNY